MKAERELLAYFAVVVCDDVPGVRVDAAQAGDFHVDAGFLVDFPLGSLDRGFADVLGAPRWPRRACPQRTFTIFATPATRSRR